MSDWLRLDAAERRALGLPERPAPPPTARLALWRRVEERLARRRRARHEARYPPPADWRRRPPGHDLVGLALSGGGIRSATFNLGLLQALHRLGLIGAFDYLSTVSGGGYVGGFWSAWLARDPDRRGFPDAEPTRERPESGEVRHLREFGNFLQPRLQLLSVETGRLVAALVGGVLPCITVALSVILLSVALWFLLAWLLLGEEPGRWGRPLGIEGLVPALVFAAGTLAVHAVTELSWRRRGETRRARATGRYAAGAVGSALVGGVVWLGLWQVVPPPRLLLRPLDLADVGVGLRAALAPVLGWAFLVFLGFVGRGLFSRWYGRRTAAEPAARSLDRLISRNVLCASLWGVVGVFWVIGQLVAGIGVPGLVSAIGTGAAGGGTFAWLRRFLGLRAGRPSGGKLDLRGRPWLLQALAYLTLGAITAAVVALLVLLADRSGTGGFLGAIGLALVVFLVALVVFDPHEVGFHSFYRSRLVRAYLGASNARPGTPPRATSECEEDDLPLTCLPDRPLHLVCCAANDLAGDPLGSLHRGAESAVLSKLGFQVGDRWRSWRSMAERPTLGDAMTASAAAFNSHMGALSMRLGHAATFLLAALGLRLGMWVPNPALSTDRLLPRLRGVLFLRELLGLSSARGSWVHLSDGAHFENLAVYELVRRHCRFVLLSDCVSDADRAFDDFGELVRKVREDFGVEIEIDLEPLRPDADGRSRQPMVAGEIRYPPAEPGGEPDVGVLLYVKPTLTGTEPADVAQYARRNERFPHESTLDQFYDEAQWESYRRLGEHVVERAFRRLVRELGAAPGRQIGRLFLHARYQWAPLPTDESTRGLDAAWARLEERLEDPALAPLRRQVGLHGARAGAPSPSEEEAAAALPAVRQALHLMESVFVDTGLGRTARSPSHRRYMGWLNRFGAWLSAPLVRGWWPWLAPFHSRDFVDFVEDYFKLGWDLAASGRLLGVPSSHPGGYALERWRAEGRPEPPQGFYAFFVELAGAGRPRLHAALVPVARDPEHPRRATWSDGDFYVAPGLWGIRVGETFLEALLRQLPVDGYDEVRVTAEHASAARDALYTGAGFDRAESGGFVLRL